MTLVPRRTRRAALLLLLIPLAAVHTAGAGQTAAPPRPLRLSGPLVQGGLVTGHTVPGATVTVDGRVVRVSDEGLFLAGFKRDARRTVIVVDLPDGRRVSRTLVVAPRRFRIQRINGLPEAMVTPPPELMPRILAEQSRLAALWGVDTGEPLFTSGFAWPARGPVTGVYGSQRILNGQPRAVHWGLDIAAPSGAPVTAPADGIVLLSQPDFYYTGGTILLDHGFGLISAFLHLSEELVTVGQRVKQGEPIGKVGATGRATGPHLDWRVRWFDVFVDPQLLLPASPRP